MSAPMNILSTDNPLPLYAQLSELLRQRILRGIFKPGDRLPSAEELAKEFSLARVTVRQAIELLQRDGLVVARQGRGTFVQRNPAAETRLKVQTTLRDLVTMLKGDEIQLLNISEGQAAPNLTETDGKPAANYVHMMRVHLREGTPYCVISIHLDEAIFCRAPERFRSELMIPLLAAMPDIDIARAHQTLTIGSADPEAAALLKLRVNAPVAHVRRVFAAPDGTVIYLGEVIYRGDLVQLEMDLVS